MGQEFEHDGAESSSQYLTRWKSGRQLGCRLIWGPNVEEVTSKLTEVVGRIHDQGPQPLLAVARG